MIGHDHSYAEPEAIRLLRALVDGDDRQIRQAHAAAKSFLRAIAQPKNQRPSGRPLRLIAPAQLREIARRVAQGERQTDIARALGVSFDLVHHHLTPSRAMLAACAEAQEATAP